jgi:hypothetical protein
MFHGPNMEETAEDRGIKEVPTARDREVPELSYWKIVKVKARLFVLRMFKGGISTTITLLIMSIDAFAGVVSKGNCHQFC